MPWYSTEHVDDISILRLKGDASTRSFQWLGGLDGLLMRGHRQLVISLEQVVIPHVADARFLVVVTQRIEDVRGAVVFIAPGDVHAQTILRQTGFNKMFPFATTVAAGRARYQPRRHPGSRDEGQQ